MNTRHVRHLLSAYVADQLSIEQAVTVREHVRTCDTCREKLAYYEQTASDLKLFLSAQSEPTSRQRTIWWAKIAGLLPSPSFNPLPSAILPVILCFLIVTLPVLMGYERDSRLMNHDEVTSISPVLDATQSPPVQTEGEEHTDTAISASTIAATPAAHMMIAPLPPVTLPTAPLLP